MENENFVKEMKQSACNIKKIYDEMYSELDRKTAYLIESSEKNVAGFENLLQQILDYCDDTRFIELFKKLCRHYLNDYPDIISDYIEIFRRLYCENSEQ